MLLGATPSKEKKIQCYKEEMEKWKASKWRPWLMRCSGSLFLSHSGLPIAQGTYRTHLLAYTPTSLHTTYFPTNLLSFTPNSLYTPSLYTPTYFPSYLLAYTPSSPHIYFPTHLLPFVYTYTTTTTLGDLLTYLPTHLLLHEFLPHQRVCSSYLHILCSTHRAWGHR